MRAAEVDGVLLLKKPAAKDTISVSTDGHVSSAMYNDVVYLHLEPQVWSRLGVSVAPKPEKVVGRVNAQIWGLSGRSRGYVMRTNPEGFLMYSGSTIPGYSGSPYLTVNNSWVGMHLGAVTGKCENRGVNGWLLAQEVELFQKSCTNYSAESRVPVATSSSTAQRQALAATSRDDEEDKRMLQRVYDAYGRTSDAWTKKTTRDVYTLNKGNPSWYDELDEESKSDPVKFIMNSIPHMSADEQRLMFAKLQASLINGFGNETIEHQGNQTGVGLLQDTAAHRRIDELERRLRALEMRAPKESTAKPAAIRKEAKTPKLQQNQLKSVQKPQQKKVEVLVPAMKVAEGAIPRECLVCKKPVKFPSTKQWRMHMFWRHPAVLRQSRVKTEPERRAVAIATESVSQADNQPLEEVAPSTSEDSFLGVVSQTESSQK